MGEGLVSFSFKFVFELRVLLQCLSLCICQLLRHDELNLYNVVTLLVLVGWELVDALPLQNQLLIVQGARLELYILFTPQGVNFDGASKSRLRECNRLLTYNVGTFPLKLGMRLHINLDQEIARISL